MGRILSLIVLSSVFLGCSTIPENNVRSISKQEISGITFKKSDGTSGSYQITKEGQKLYLEVGEYWSKITIQGILTDTNSRECKYVKTEDIVSFSVSDYLLNKY